MVINTPETPITTLAAQGVTKSNAFLRTSALSCIYRVVYILTDAFPAMLSALGEHSPTRTTTIRQHES